MKIELPYNFGDTVYYMKDNRVRTAIVSSIKVSGKYATQVYAIPQGNTCLEQGFTITKVFKSKEDLLETL